jgi:hypothetical protein
MNNFKTKAATFAVFMANEELLTRPIALEIRNMKSEMPSHSNKSK